MVRSIAVNPEALAGGDFTPIPNGTKLRVSVYDIEEGKVKNGPNAGKDQAMFTVKVTEDGPYKGREIKYNYIPLFAGAGNAWFLAAFAAAVGWPIDKETNAIEIPDNLKDVVGTEFIAVIRETESQKINPDTGKPYINNQVNGARKIKSGGDAPKGGGAPERPVWGA